MTARRFTGVFACPADGSTLSPDVGGVWSGQCGHRYRRGDHGYMELFVPDDAARHLTTSIVHCAPDQERGGARLYEAYVRDWLHARSPTGGGSGAGRVLDAGCGPGVTAAAMLADGVDAYGVDLPGAASRWREHGYDADRFVCGNVTRLPFTDDAFDSVVTVGVIEHVGTTTGHLTLAPDADAHRERFAHELLRVTRPGGRILLSCPNKWFPIDVQHGPNDEQTHSPLRTRMFERTGLNVHPVFGRYHLASYADVARWFRGNQWRALPLRGFFGFSALERSGPARRLAGLARGYVETLPPLLRRTPLNPYVLVEVTA